jgi:hypothetical protein
VDTALLTSAGMAPLVIGIAAWLRTVLANWITPARLTQLMPLVVVLVSLALVLAGRLLPLPAHDVLAQLVEVAAMAMAGYSGVKAAVGAS